MKKLAMCLTLLVLVTVSCNKNAQNETLEFELQSFEQKSTVNCAGNDCTEVELHIPIIVNKKNEIADMINANNVSVIGSIISLNDSTVKVDNFEALAKQYITEYESFVKKYPDENIPWKATVSGDITFVNDQLISFAFDYYTFAGGAHGFENEMSINYNPKTGKAYKVEELIKDWDGLQKLLYMQLRNKSDLFDTNNKLEYPESIFFYDDTIGFMYNAFDTEVFSDGPIKIELEKKAVLPFLAISLELKDNKQNK
ncbi:MAG: DUF4163 domain-containing protein [Flavobacteriaceae bacterium]|jgi:hypothetical protein|nr:DUF4163 domain-containing protein [Flavobacteriaceae bacterium]